MQENETTRVEESLERLGIEELEERLELAPIVAAGDGTLAPDDGEGDGCCRDFCRCSLPSPTKPDIPGDFI